MLLDQVGGVSDPGEMASCADGLGLSGGRRVRTSDPSNCRDVCSTARPSPHVLRTMQNAMKLSMGRDFIPAKKYDCAPPSAHGMFLAATSRAYTSGSR